MKGRCGSLLRKGEVLAYVGSIQTWKDLWLIDLRLWMCQRNFMLAPPYNQFYWKHRRDIRGVLQMW